MLLVNKIFVICHIIKLHYITQLIAPLVNTELLRFTVRPKDMSLFNVFYVERVLSKSDTVILKQT